jgi:hypothetical protein
MSRRSLGRGRILVGVGAVVILVACLFPWGQTEGLGLPPERTGAFDGFGIVVFIAAVLLLALLVLPYAGGDQAIALDRPIVFAVVLGTGALGFVLKLVQVFQDGVLGLPDRSLGLWLAGIGLAIATCGVAEMTSEVQEA